MKILVMGDPNRLKKYKKFECSECGCVLIADRTEYINCSSQRDGAAFTINCPCCRKKVYDYTYDYISYDEYSKSKGMSV